MTIIDTLAASPIASGVGAIIVAVVSGITIRKWQRRKENQDEVKQWYRDSLGLTGRLQQAGYRTTSYQEADYPTLREKLEPLAEELQEHASSAPEGVEEAAQVELLYLAAFSTELITLTEQAEEFDAAEFFENVQEHARKMYDGEHDIEDVYKLIESFDDDALIEDLESDVETDDEAIEEFLGHFNEESVEAGQPTAIGEALEMPIGMIDETVEEDGVWEHMVTDTIRQFIRMVLIEIAEDVSKSMELRKQKV